MRKLGTGVWMGREAQVIENGNQTGEQVVIKTGRKKVRGHLVGGCRMAGQGRWRDKHGLGEVSRGLRLGLRGTEDETVTFYHCISYHTNKNNATHALQVQFHIYDIFLSLTKSSDMIRLPVSVCCSYFFYFASKGGYKHNKKIFGSLGAATITHL